MLQADALFHAAREAYAVELTATGTGDREAKQRRREQLVGQATQALRRGLHVDPHHVGLLFLKANAVQRGPVGGRGQRGPGRRAAAPAADV